MADLAGDDFAEDQVIRADLFSGPARVKKFEERSGYYRLEVTLEESGEFRSLSLTPDQLDQVERVQANPIALSSDPEEFFLLVEANRIRLAHQFDPMLAVSVSQVDPLPHQIEAVYHYALEMPRLRFMIADDPGAGKTIMAGLILKEMQQRGLVKRVLVVAPGHLKYQWQRELKERFGAGFRLIDRSAIRAQWGENVWAETPLSIASVDFLKQDDIKATLPSARWDLVIVDEAHKMSAYAYETKKRTKIDKTKRYQVGEVLSEQTEHMLFLTATPHKGDEENFRLFLDLLRPGFFANEEMLKESVEEGENPLFIRRLKEDMMKFDGEPIFPPRHVKTTRFRLTEKEQRLYNSVTSYVKSYYDQAKEKRHITFAMVILQRRLTSSVYAILSSLERRRAKLEEYLKYPEQIAEDRARYEEALAITEEEMDELSEEERWEIEDRRERVTIAGNIEEVETEIDQLDELVAQAERVKGQKTESKLRKLREEILSSLEGRKLLIFTEHKDTLYYLEEKLREWGYAVNTIHGGMGLDARIEAEHTFQNETQIMVATEAAGEGINLQFCSLMVNYDIPWNPNRLEQRMGRIHRYGQDREVYIWNLIAKGTREGQILDKLFTKLDRMREALGTDRVFDIIGEVLPGTNLKDLLTDAITGQRRMEDIEHEIEEVDEATTSETLERVFASSLASRHIDYTGLMKEQLMAEENRLVPEYVQDYFLRGFERIGGEYAAIEKGFRVESVPLELRQKSKDLGFKTRFGTVRRSYRRVTFEKEVARRDNRYEFVAPGHPLLEALTETILEEFQHGGTEHAAFYDPEDDRTGALWFVEGVVRDGTGAVAGRRVFCVLQSPRGSNDGDMQELNPAVLWDLEPVPDADVPEEVADLLSDRTAIEDHLTTEVLMPYRGEIQERRSSDAEIKERYGLRSLDHLIQESNQKLLDYEMRSQAGEDMGAATRQEERNLRELQQRHEDLEKEIRLERNVTVNEPKVLGVAALVPAPEPVALEYATPDGGGKEAHDEGGDAEYRTSSNGSALDSSADAERKREIELAGMRVAMDHERERGWQPQDVSEAAHGGFDVRSMRFSDEDGRHVGTRYIEVKARSRSGKVRITRNEWMQARKYGDEYWLYIVTEAGTNAPQLTARLQNPAERFVEGESIFASGFEIPEEQWREAVREDEQGSETNDTSTNAPEFFERSDDLFE